MSPCIEVSPSPRAAVKRGQTLTSKHFSRRPAGNVQKSKSDPIMGAMARRPAVLVTGANGEMGHGLIPRLGESGRYEVVALDLRPLEAELARWTGAAIVGDILDRRLLERLTSEFEIHAIFHLALLSTRAEFTPEVAH